MPKTMSSIWAMLNQRYSFVTIYFQKKKKKNLENGSKQESEARVLDKCRLEPTAENVWWQN